MLIANPKSNNYVVELKKNKIIQNYIVLIFFPQLVLKSYFLCRSNILHEYNEVNVDIVKIINKMHLC